eukprot:6245590-Prymnesium_polylepis.1
MRVFMCMCMRSAFVASPSLGAGPPPLPAATAPAGRPALTRGESAARGDSARGGHWPMVRREAVSSATRALRCL